MATSAIFSKYAEYYDLFNQDKPYKDEIKFVYNWADKPRWLFDIGCATGKYWKFYPKSINIFGVDKSQEMLDKINDPRLVGYDAADIANYSHIKKFDCATALFDVINYIPKHDWWKNLPIKKGGYLTVDDYAFWKIVLGYGVKKAVDEFVRNHKKIDLRVDGGQAILRVK